MGDHDYHSTRMNGRRADQMDDGFYYEASSRRAALPQHPQRTQQYLGQQSDQYVAYETGDAGYGNTPQYPSVQDQRFDQRMPDPDYWSGSASANIYQDQTGGYSQDLPDPKSGETRGEASTRRPSGRSDEPRDVRQDVPLRSINQHEDEDEIDFYMKSRDKQWVFSRGIRDTGNRGPHFVGSEKVLSLGFDHNYIDFDDVKQFRTLGGHYWTFGSIRLNYTSTDGAERQDEFQVFDSKDIGEYDVIFSNRRIDEPIIERSPPMLLTTIGSKKKADRETRKRQERIFKQREQEAREEEEEALKAARRKRRQQSTDDPRYSNQHTDPTYGGETSLRNLYPNTKP